MAEDKQKEGVRIEDFAAKYEACKDIKNVDAIQEFDELRRETYKDAHKRAMKDKDPAAMHEALAGLFGQIKQDLSYFAGKAGVKAEDESPLERNIRAGMGAFNDHYGEGRRRR